MADEHTKYGDDTKSGVGAKINPSPKEGNFEEGDEVEMTIYEKDDKGENNLVPGAFVIRAAQLNDEGDWVYQLNKDGEHYNGEEWFSESELF